MSGREQAVCSALLVFVLTVLCSISIGASSYSGQTCSGNKKPADTSSSSYCPASFKPVSECQAVENYPLRLVCSRCSSGIHWQRWNDSTDSWEELSCTKQTLEYQEVDQSLKGCYECWCYLQIPSMPGDMTGRVYFSVDVQPPEPPKLTMHSHPQGNGEFILDPVTVNLVANQQMLCFPFTSTGYPNVEYVMYYKASEEGDYLPVTANQSCLVQSGDSLCYIPPVRTSSQIGDFMSKIHNLAGNITALQTVSYNADPIWPIKPHPAQTSGNVTIDHNSGVGKAVCAAYQEDPDVNEILYFICLIPNGRTAEEAACLYNQHPPNLECYLCGGVGRGFNSTSGSSYSDLGIEAESCFVNVWEESQFVCLAQRQWLNGSTSMYQQIGNFTTSKLEPQPTPQPSVTVCELDTVQIGLITGIAVLLVALTACCCLACCCMWCMCSKHKKGTLVKKSKEGGQGEVLSENSQLLPWSWSRSKPKPKPRTGIRFRFHAPGDPNFTDIPSAYQYSGRPFLQELGMEYEVQFLLDSNVHETVVLATPEDNRKALESFPPELEKAVPLEPLSVLPYCDRLAPHYEAVAYIVGADTTVRWLRQGNDDLPNKVFRILEEWILTGKATWATLVLRLEHYIPRLRGLASDIRKDLREALEKSSLPNGVDGMSRSQSAPPLHDASRQPSSGIPVIAEITPQSEVGGQLQDQQECASRPHFN